MQRKHILRWRLHAFAPAGMSFIAATLLLIVMDAPVAFRCFCNMVARHTYFDIVRLDAQHVRRTRPASGSAAHWRCG